MNEKDFTKLHKEIDKIPVAKIKENGWTLVSYAEVKCAIDRIHNKKT